MSFEDLLFGNRDREAYQKGFKAGQQSKQSEVDDLENKLLLEKLSKTSHKLASEEKEKQIESVNQILKDLKESKYMHSANKSYNAIMIEKLEKALRGHDQYTEHRTKAEQQINNGARLTKHQIDLGSNNRINDSSLIEAEKLNRLG